MDVHAVNLGSNKLKAAEKWVLISTSTIALIYCNIGIAIHAVACRGMAEENIWKKIADETWGQFLRLQDAGKLPDIITGVAEADLNKQKTRIEVQAYIEKLSDTLKKLSEEEER